MLLPRWARLGVKVAGGSEGVGTGLRTFNSGWKQASLTKPFERILAFATNRFECCTTRFTAKFRSLQVIGFDGFLFCGFFCRYCKWHTAKRYRVRMTTLEFTSHYPDCKIVATGSTPTRTRLYQMGIAKHYKEISEMFDIQGLTEKSGWQPFTSGENYLALLVSRK